MGPGTNAQENAYIVNSRLEKNDITAHGGKIINSHLGEKAIHYAHNALTAVHIGSRKVIHWIRQRYWWKQMATEIADHCKHCKTCQRMKFFSQPGAGFMQMRVYDRPGRSICIDIVVLNHRSEKGTEYLFTILDSFSHYPDAYGVTIYVIPH